MRNNWQGRDVTMTSAPTTDAFSPSAYSAALVKFMLSQKQVFAGADVLDIGCGSGVLLRAAFEFGAASLSGVDIEAQAIAASRHTLAPATDAGVAVNVTQGHLYDPFKGQRFDMILANLPQFPMYDNAVGSRLASWSAGGTDGRRQLHPVLHGLCAHLAPTGQAIITHNAFVGLDATRELLREYDMSLAVVDRFMTPLSRAKAAAIAAPVLDREIGHTLHRFGDVLFAEVAVAHITRSLEKPILTKDAAQ